jgi:UDP-3-O-[3-hydroxymyristoyl] glucosamine N-acyltransferase
MAGKTLAQLAEHVGGTVIGDPEMVITAVATLENATAGEITFLSNKKYFPLVKETSASAVITSSETESNAALLIAENAYYAFMQIVVLLHGHRKHAAIGLSEKASIAASAKFGKNCNVHDLATIGENATLGDNCIVYPGAFIGPGVTMGDDCIIYPSAVVFDGTVIGDRVIIQSNATVGHDGYGFATHKGVHYKIPQIGRAILEDDVEIGASSAIERGTLEDTIIGAGTKIGDMVTIGHGSKLGPGCLIVPQVGISGSSTIGHHCVFAGQSATNGHVTVGNMVTVGGQTGVTGNLPDGATVFGTPALEIGLAKRAYASIGSLPDMRKRIRKLEKQLKKMGS